jgi:hypothetical protein
VGALAEGQRDAAKEQPDEDPASRHSGTDRTEISQAPPEAGRTGDNTSAPRTDVAPVTESPRIAGGTTDAGQAEEGTAKTSSVGDRTIRHDASLHGRDGSEGAAISPDERQDDIRYAEEPESPWAADAYQRIREATGDVAEIASHCGLDPAVIDGAKRNLFIDVHDVQLGPDVVVRARFTPSDQPARLWLRATDGTLRPTEVEAFRRLVAHEYVENKLMDAGLPYRSAHASNYTEDGVVKPTPEHHGAHDLAPLEHPDRDPFNHWKALGREAPTIRMARDLSNLDQIVAITLQGRTDERH